MEKYLIVGLGNPSPEYDGTRHNAGREAVWFWLAPLALVEGPPEGQTPSRYPAPLPGQMSIPQFKGRAHRINLNNRTIVAAYDLGTFMNESGRAVETVLNFLKIPPTGLILVHDELALPLGRLRLDRNISAAGHKGVASVMDALGTQDVVRLRLGIESRTDRTVPGEDFVLEKFTAEEGAAAKAMLRQAADRLTAILTVGCDRAMTDYNRSA